MNKTIVNCKLIIYLPHQSGLSRLDNTDKCRDNTDRRYIV